MRCEFDLIKWQKEYSKSLVVTVILQLFQIRYSTNMFYNSIIFQQNNLLFDSSSMYVTGFITEPNLT